MIRTSFMSWLLGGLEELRRGVYVLLTMTVYRLDRQPRCPGKRHIWVGFGDTPGQTATPGSTAWGKQAATAPAGAPIVCKY
jgi:hypothetical protein